MQERIYDLRERMVRMETSHQHHYEWTRSIATHLAGIDERLRKNGSRIGQAHDKVHAHAELLAELKSLPEKMAALERAQKIKSDMMRYMAAAAIMGLALLGKGDMNEAIKIFAKVAGIGI